jgi:YVTN family beta-propeller protein
MSMTMRHLLLCSVLMLPLGAGSCRTDRAQIDRTRVGQVQHGAVVVPTRQLIRPAGKSIEFHGRPVDLVLAHDGKTLYVKADKDVLAIDVATWTLRQSFDLHLSGKAGPSMHGIAITPDDKRLYVTASGSNLVEIDVDDSGEMSAGRRIKLPGAQRGESYPCGIALLPASQRAIVCLSMDNSLAIVDLGAGKVIKRIPVGVAPFDVAISNDGTTAYVSNWGGRHPRQGDLTADSAGTPTVVDQRGIASSGTVGIVDLASGKMTSEIPVGLHPSDVELSTDGISLFVANANSDTVSVIDLSASPGPHSGPSPEDRKREFRVINIPVRPDEKLPFGSMSNALALSGDQLYVADGGNNAVAVVDRADEKVRGFIPTGWYPGAICSNGKQLFIANIKGLGSRDPQDAGKWRTHSYWGSITRVDIPSQSALAGMTKQVRADALVPQTLAAWEKAQSDAAPVPVPAHIGEPSVFDHVIYIIKENRTYDQLFGDLPKGNNDPKLCVFGRRVTPNQHALAEQFALLDNYYCNGVVSTDGHAWATEGLAVDYLEKTFGAWARSYPFWANDPLALAPTGFIWDDALLHQRSFRNYGEMSTTKVHPSARYAQILHDYKEKAGQFTFERDMPVESLRQYSCADSPGWNLQIPDQIRADVFLKEFGQNEQSGNLADLTILYLPQDHTLGTKPSGPTPEAMVADNDLAVGRVVDAISHSRFWARTCIFIIEDDPQAGFDHVDGHRSICLVISPYTKRRQIVSNFYNQTSVLHTIELMLGIPPMNQFDAMSPAMGACFTSKPDLTPYVALPNQIPLDQTNPPASALRGTAQQLAMKSEHLPLELPDQCDEDTLNRIIWQSARGDEPYPAAFAGAHGRGLEKLHLKLDAKSGKVEDDD